MWRARIRGLSTDPASDLSGVANDEARVRSNWDRHRAEFMGVPGVVSFGITGLGLWAPLRGDERFGTRGVLDGALSVGVRDVESLPRGPLFVEGVPVVVRVVGVPRRVSTGRLRAEG